MNNKSLLFVISPPRTDGKVEFSFVSTDDGAGDKGLIRLRSVGETSNEAY